MRERIFGQKSDDACEEFVGEEDAQRGTGDGEQKGFCEELTNDAAT